MGLGKRVYQTLHERKADRTEKTDGPAAPWSTSNTIWAERLASEKPTLTRDQEHGL